MRSEPFERVSRMTINALKTWKENNPCEPEGAESLFLIRANQCIPADCYGALNLFLCGKFTWDDVMLRYTHDVGTGGYTPAGDISRWAP